MFDEPLWYLSLGFLVALVWCGYLGLRFSRLASIEIWESLLLTALFTVPLLAVYYVFDLSFRGGFLALVCVLIFVCLSGMQHSKYGTFGKSGRLRMLQYGPNKARIIEDPSDIEKIDILVLSQKQMQALSTGDEAMPESLSWALINDVDIMSLNTYMERKLGYIAVSENIDPNSVRFHRDPFYNFCKRSFDLIVSIILGILFAIPMLICAIAVLLLDGRPIFFPQERIGKGGKTFKIIKFRTMENNDGADEKTTRLGMFLRQLHFDELPQIFNIIMGQMSLIGPRPEWVLLTTPEMAPRSYWVRQTVRPGLTGWAQVNYKPSRTRTMRQRKLGFDLYYINNRSLFLDMLIFMRTMFRLPVFLFSLISEKKRRLSS